MHLGARRAYSLLNTPLKQNISAILGYESGYPQSIYTLLNTPKKRNVSFVRGFIPAYSQSIFHARHTLGT